MAQSPPEAHQDRHRQSGFGSRRASNPVVLPDAAECGRASGHVRPARRERPPPQRRWQSRYAVPAAGPGDKDDCQDERANRRARHSGSRADGRQTPRRVPQTSGRMAEMTLAYRPIRSQSPGVRWPADPARLRLPPRAAGFPSAG